MPKKGRPAKFDRTEALQRAMELFWARGYEGVTLEDLQVAMGGITPPSFYHAFGSKEELFLRAADLYVATVGDAAVTAMRETQNAREAIESLLRLTAESFSLSGKPHGCLLVLGATNCAAANRRPQNYLRSIRRRAPALIEQRLQRAVDEGEIRPDANTAAIAAFYATVIHGLAVRAGDGASRKQLMAAVKGAMAAWDAF